MAAYFAHHRYAVETNRILTGRSGGRHEIDVLAEKSDALTSFRVAVECKAWNSPIEKDVVSKLHYVMSDLGLNKSVIVSLAGARSGAATAAAELGIDIWGPDQLRHHLGAGFLADIAAPAPTMRPSGRMLDAWRFSADPGRARQTAAASGRGRLGMRELETLAWFSPIWVPAYLLFLTVAQPTRQRLRQHVASSPVVNVYDALDGLLQNRPAAAPIELAAGDIVVLKPLQREAQIHSVLRKAVEARLKVTSPAAIQRHDARLATLGLPVPLHSVSIDQTRLVHPSGARRAPATTTGASRVVAVDGITGQLECPPRPYPHQPVGASMLGIHALAMGVSPPGRPSSTEARSRDRPCSLQPAARQRTAKHRPLEVSNGRCAGNAAGAYRAVSRTIRRESRARGPFPWMIRVSLP